MTYGIHCMITDGVQNLLTLARSTIDPISSNIITSDSYIDRETWYRNGGIASTIVDYWPQLIGSGIELTIDDNTKGSKRTEIESLIRYLQQRYSDLDLENILIKLYTGIHFNSYSAASIDAYGSNWASPMRAGVDINGLTLIAEQIEEENIDQKPTGKYIVDRQIVDRSRILVMKGRHIYNNRYNGCSLEPLLNSATINAAVLYEQAVKTSATLLQLKSTMTMGISNYNDGMRKEQAGEYSRGIIKIVEQLQTTNKILNVNLHDKNETTIQVLERSLSQVDAIVDRIRDYLLSSTNNIPETRLFGSSRVGGLSKSNDDDSRTNSEAARIFQTTWRPLISQLNGLLVREKKSPSARLLGEVTIARKSSNPTDRLADARIRLINAQAAKLELEMGSDR